MVENRGFDILDYFVLVLKWKKFLLITFISVFVLSYLIIYIFIPVEYESSALIVPSGNESSMGGVSGLMKNLKDLPLGIGGLSKSSETDLYITIIYSRSTLEKLIGKFDLLKDYNLISMEKALKKLKKNIKGSLTRESAFEIIVRASSPQKAAEMTNFLLSLLNESVINLNITKSRNNREFLEKRYNDIRARLKDAEDSLQLYQQYSGLLEAKEQAHLMLNTYSKLQGDVIEKQMELSIMEKITAGDSPQLKLMKTQLEEYETELGKMKRNGGDKNVLL
ncbi:MAG: Wzz/FepE/Etk N-terminal domain-containing protein, partial [Ignavibacteria bacterium]